MAFQDTRDTCLDNIFTREIDDLLGAEDPRSFLISPHSSPLFCVFPVLTKTDRTTVAQNRPTRTDKHKSRPKDRWDERDELMDKARAGGARRRVPECTQEGELPRMSHSRGG